MNNLEKYENVFVKIFDVTTEELNDRFTFKDVDAWDSLSHMTLVCELEDEFGIMMDTEDILNFGSYENGINILKRYGVCF